MTKSIYSYGRALDMLSAFIISVFRQKKSLFYQKRQNRQRMTAGFAFMG